MQFLKSRLQKFSLVRQTKIGVILQRNGYEVNWNCCDDGSGWFSPYKIGTELYELGKYSEIAFKLESERPSLFTSDKLKERYSDYGFVLLTKDDFKAVIEAYRQKIVDWFENLLNPDKSQIISDKLSKEERKHLEWEHEIKGKLEKWSGKYFDILPIDLDENRGRITDSWSYEYAIFELIRLYKVFDWENNELVLVGW